MGNKNKYKDLIKFLRDIRNTIEPWIHRKEISMWSASALYLAIIITITKLFYDHSIYIPLIFNIISAIIIWVLFGLFIQKQFSSLADALSVQKAVTIWIVRLIDNKDILRDFDFNIDNDKVLPKSIQDMVNHQRKIVQKYRWYSKPFIPLLVIFSNKRRREISNFEAEEAVIYFIITMVTLFYIIFSHFYINCEKFV